MEKDTIMKNIKLVSLVPLFVLLSISCRLFTPGSSSDNSNVPNDSVNNSSIDFTTPAEPLNITVELDETSTVRGTFSTNGNAMTLTAADGTVFKLAVPPGALDRDTAITMTAVKSITGAPLSSGTVAAVQLEPSGLFFNEFVTLTVIPAQEIPIENQIIFAYEGAGQDYHLAIIDPKSREIRIKLLEFSGAGVGSGGDKEWAANLQHQANDSRVRFQNEVAKLLQPERLAQLLGEEPNDQISSILKSYMEKYYDQVIQKEMVAAELDCKYAEKAIQDLIGLERNNQLLGLNGADANGETIPIVDDLAGKIAKLVKIGEKCNKVYSANGIWGPASLTGEIDTSEDPFTLVVSGGCTGEMMFSGGADAGEVSCAVTCGGILFNGAGPYTITYAGDGGEISGSCSSLANMSGDTAEVDPLSVALQRIP